MKTVYSRFVEVHRQDNFVSEAKSLKLGVLKCFLKLAALTQNVVLIPNIHWDPIQLKYICA